MGSVITSTLWSTICVICEDFLEFVSIYDATGVSLASTILQTLRKNDLDLRYLHVQGYDGAAAMSGEFRGVQIQIIDTNSERNIPKLCMCTAVLIL